MLIQKRPSSHHLLARFQLQDGGDEVRKRFPGAGFKGSGGEILFDHAAGEVWAGLGPVATLDGCLVRRFAGMLARAVRKTAWRQVVISLENVELPEAVVEGILLGMFSSRRKSDSKPPILQFLLPENAGPALRRRLERSMHLSRAANYAREIANRRGNECGPADLAAAARELGREHDLRVTVLDEKQLRRAGFGALLAVGGGSSRPPRLVAMEYRGAKHAGADLALVGKAITFDTGGISLKPPTDLWEMIFDKAGGVAVLGVMKALGLLRPKLNVTAVLACAENMPSGTACRPGDLVTAYNGKTVEIDNTDAEGRLVLGDAMAFTLEKFEPKRMIDVATLTGAVGVALGDSAAGLWSTDDALAKQLIDAAGQSGERVWPMPLYSDYEEAMKGRFGDLRNATGDRKGGACKAAAFLKAFVGQTPWAHLDIAEMSMTMDERRGLDPGATGFGVRLLAEYVERLARTSGKKGN